MPHQIPAGFVAHDGKVPPFNEGIGAIGQLRDGQRVIVGPKFIDSAWTTAWMQTGAGDDIVAYRPLDTAVPDSLASMVERFLHYEEHGDPITATLYRSRLRDIVAEYRAQWPFVRCFAEVRRVDETFDNDTTPRDR